MDPDAACGAQAAGAWPGPWVTPIGRSKAARSVGRCGAMDAPSGSSSPVSSKITTPLQSRLQPCSGWLTMVCAASRSGSKEPDKAACVGTYQCLLAVSSCVFSVGVQCAAGGAVAHMAQADRFPDRHL